MEAVISILFLFIIVGVINKVSLTNDNSNKSKDKKTLVALNCIYIGGCPKVLDSHIKSVAIEKDDNNLILYKYPKDILSIPLDNIMDVTVQSKEEISKRVTISRLIVLGVFAFGVPKKEKNVTKYIVISYLNGKGEEEDIVIEHKSAPIIAEKLHKAIPELN